MKNILHVKIEDVPRRHRNEHVDYEYFRRVLVPIGTAEQCNISILEIPPGKSAYPYHYHVKNEEIFYIISGQGVLKTPSGEKPVAAGEVIYFPANENGAHKLTNSSDTEMLVYMDFDTSHDLDVCFYPDSGKIGVWGKGIDQLYEADETVEYYEGE